MPVRDIKGGASAASPEGGGVLDAEQTLRMLALPGAGARSRRTKPGIEVLHHATFVQLPTGVAYANREGHFIWCNAAFEQMLGLEPGEYRQNSIREFIHADDIPASGEMLADLWEGRTSSYALEKRFVRRDGTILWAHITAALIRTPEGAPVCTVGFLRDITQRKKMEAEVERVQKELVDASRQAGMAEVATNVLHNVGNVLNSVNVSASLVAERIKASKGPRLAEVATLIEKNSADLPRFISEDERGRKLPRYLRALATQLATERDQMLAELANLRANIDHIREAVSMQQTYARRFGVLEDVGVVDLVEDSLRMNAGALTRHHVALERDYRDRPQVVVERHKALQILVNLIRNAKYACDESGRSDKKVILRISTVVEGACVEVIDNGIGIAPEVMERLFTHGFTTRQSGHGFGLHSASLAAAELGGTLTAASDGAGKGATFRLTLPLKAPEKRQ
jgi:PAS domain S-box-containing protein